MTKEIAEEIAEFFEDEPWKITMWWFTENPFFGGTTPAKLYLMRPKKAEQVILSLLRGDIA